MEMSETRINALDLNQQAAMLIKTGNIEAARKKLDSAIELDPMLKDSYKNYGDLNMAINDYQEAKNNYKKAFLIEKDGLLYFLYGNACFMKDEVHEGLEYYNLAIANGYDGEEMMFFMGMAYEHLNDEHMALRYYQKACLKNPSRPDYIVKKISTELRLDMIDSAEQDTDELLKTAPELYDGYHIKTQILIHKGEYDKAASFAKEASDRFAEDADLRYDYIKALAMKKDFNTALTLIDQAAQMKYYEDSKLQFLMLKAEILAEDNKYDEAMDVCNKCIELETDGEINSEARFMAMNLHLAKPDYEESLKQAITLVKNNKEDLYYYAALYYKAFCLKQLEKTEEAGKAYKEANSIYRLHTLSNPAAIDVYLYRAMCLKDLEEYDKSLEILDFILNLGVDIAEVHTLKADVYDLTGKHGAAAQEREKAYALKPELRPDEQKAGE